MSAYRLNGMRVLVTRPQPQSARLAAHLEKLGAEVFQLPMIQIAPLELPADNPLIQADVFQKVVVISPPAADIALQHLSGQTITADWFTPGKGTAKILNRQNIQVSYPETGFTSEALLQLPVLNNIGNENILLLKGEGGRDELEQTLTERGASVTTLPLYQRVCPHYSPGLLDDTVAEHQFHAIVATSGQIVENLLACSRSDSIIHIPLLVPSERVALLAQGHGFQHTVICKSAGDDDIATALVNSIHS